jgi:hypothetical protein
MAVNPDGTVGATFLEGNLGEATISQCISDDAMTWRFPPHAGTGCAEVTIPFAFAPPP